jgi:integrase/recombinase XerD
VILRLASLRFFYIHVLKRNWSIAETPYPKKMRHLPGVLSQEEVARLIEAADTPFHRILLMTMYATGARRAEAAHLRVSDIDSQRMVVHIREGKGGKDRDVMLSPKLLEELRIYWRGLRRKPKEWLFPGNCWHTASYPVTTKALWSACQIAAERAGLESRNIDPAGVFSSGNILPLPGFERPPRMGQSRQSCAICHQPALAVAYRLEGTYDAILLISEGRLTSFP